MPALRSRVGFVGRRGGAPVVTPADFGTLEAWIDPRYDLTESGGAVTDWNDHSAHARNGIVVGAPAYEATGWNGMPSVLFDGSDDGVYWSAVGAAFSGSDVPLYVVASVQLVAAGSGNKNVFGCSNSASAVNYRRCYQASSRWSLQSNDGTTNKFTAGDVGSADSGRHILRYSFGGTTKTLLEDGASISLDGVDQDIASVTLDNFSIAFRRGSSNVEFFNARYGPVLVYSAVTDLAGAEQWLIDEGYGP